MDSKNKEEIYTDRVRNTIVPRDIRVLVNAGKYDYLLPIALVVLMFSILVKPIEWIIDIFLNLVYGKKIKPQKSEKTAEIKQRRMRFSCSGKKVIIKLIVLDLLIFTFSAIILIALGKLEELFFSFLIILLGTVLFAISCDIYATISADENKIYIEYRYFGDKVKVKTIALKYIKKIIISENKIKITTIMGHTTLTVEPDSEAYAYFSDLKQKMNV